MFISPVVLSVLAAFKRQTRGEQLRPATAKIILLSHVILTIIGIIGVCRKIRQCNFQ